MLVSSLHAMKHIHLRASSQMYKWPLNQSPNRTQSSSIASDYQPQQDNKLKVFSLHKCFEPGLRNSDKNRWPAVAVPHLINLLIQSRESAGSPACLTCSMVPKRLSSRVLGRYKFLLSPCIKAVQAPCWPIHQTPLFLPAPVILSPFPNAPRCEILAGR